MPFINFQLPTSLKQRVAVTAASLDISKSEAMRQAAELWLASFSCPQCDRLTIPHPNPTMEGVRYCPFCQEAVGFIDPARIER